MKRRERYNKSVYRSLAMFMQFSLHMLVPICMMSALGVWLDRKLGTSFIMIILFFVGVAAGAQNVYRLAGRPARRKDAAAGKAPSRAKDASAGKAALRSKDGQDGAGKAAGRYSEEAGVKEEPVPDGGVWRKNGIGQDTGGSENDQ